MMQCSITNVCEIFQTFRLKSSSISVVCQAHAYTNATFCITSARSSWDDGHFELIAGTCIINPEGFIIGESKTLDDELVVAEIDLEECL